eukprot:jgi/Astpho2/9691/Aster-03683
MQQLRAAFRVEIQFSLGSVVVELYTQHAPKVDGCFLTSVLPTCENFLQLAKRQYYNSTVVHRVIPDFMIQMGDPTGTGRGGESAWGGKFEDEITQALHHTGAGILSMANAGPNTNGSQFFITLAPTPWLDSKHTIFGRVCSGMGVVKRLVSPEAVPRQAPVRSTQPFSHGVCCPQGNVATDPRSDRPTTEVKILRTIPI